MGEITQSIFLVFMGGLAEVESVVTSQSVVMMNEHDHPNTTTRALTDGPEVRRFAAMQSALLRRYDVDATSYHVGADPSRPIHVLAAGDGPPCVLVQGGGGVAAFWAGLMKELADDFQCLAIDRPGHGLSYGIDYRKVQDYRDDAADFMARALDGLGLDKATLIGNSMGGFFSIAFALAHPERVERLVLVGAPAGIDREIPIPLRMLAQPVIGPLMWKTIARPSERGLLRLHRDLLMADATKLPPEHIACGVAGFRLPGADVAWLTLLRRFVTLRGLDERCWIRDELERLDVPTHFVWGERDAFTSPTVGEEIASAMPRASFHVVPSAGHLPWLDAPGRCGSAIREFLRRTATAAGTRSDAAVIAHSHPA
jgi:pimeloyl-ACP methyl ester carboxylesterase